MNNIFWYKIHPIHVFAYKVGFNILSKIVLPYKAVVVLAKIFQAKKVAIIYSFEITALSNKL